MQWLKVCLGETGRNWECGCYLSTRTPQYLLSPLEGALPSPTGSESPTPTPLAKDYLLLLLPFWGQQISLTLLSGSLALRSRAIRRAMAFSCSCWFVLEEKQKISIVRMLEETGSYPHPLCAVPKVPHVYSCKTQVLKPTDECLSYC